MAEAALSVVDYFVRQRVPRGRLDFVGGLEEGLSIGFAVACLVAATRVSEALFRAHLLQALYWTFFPERGKPGLTSLSALGRRLRASSLSSLEEDDYETPDHRTLQPWEQPAADDLAEAIAARLSGRDADIFRMLLDRMPVAEMAQQLNVSTNRVRQLIARVQHKAAEVAGWARRPGRCEPSVCAS
jgi:hypothetical protein